MVDNIIDFVTEFGIQTNDNGWYYKGISVVKDNDIKGIVWGPRLNVFQVEEDEPTYSSGTEDDLWVLYFGVLNDEVPMVEQ